MKSLTLALALPLLDRKQPIRTAIEVADFAHAPGADLVLLSSSDPDIRNTFKKSNCDRTGAQDNSMQHLCTIELPLDSVAILTLHRSGSK